MGRNKERYHVSGDFGIALAASLMHIRPAGIDPAWAAIILCGIPIILEAVIGLVTAFDIKADVLVSMALIASVIIGEIFAAGKWLLSCSWGSSGGSHCGEGQSRD